MLGAKYLFSESLGHVAAVELAAGVDASNGHEVAFERLQRTAASTDSALHFRDRVRAFAAVREPGLLEIHDHFEHAGAFYVVSEPAPGESLASRLAREPVAVDQLLTWLAEAMRAVSALHGAGLVHGAVCPAAIFLARTELGAERARVAPLVLAGLCASGRADDQRLCYGSMEALAGTVDLDARADVYAFGAIAYQALAGRSPFDADATKASSTLLRIMTEAPVPLGRVRTDLPDELSALIDLTLAKRREQRLSSLDGLRALLEPWIEVLRRRTQPPRTRPPNAASQPATENAPCDEQQAPSDAEPQSARLSGAVRADAVAARAGAGHSGAGPQLHVRTEDAAGSTAWHARALASLPVAIRSRPPGGARIEGSSVPASTQSLQPIVTPATRTPPPRWAAGWSSDETERAGRRAALIALAALAAIAVAGWVRGRGETAGSTALPPPSAAALRSATTIAADPATLSKPPSTAASGNASGADTGLKPGAVHSTNTTASSADSRVDATGAGSNASTARAIGAATATNAQGAASAEAGRKGRRGRRAPRTAAAAAPPSAGVNGVNPDCSPNYVFDAQGEKHWKPQCF